MLTILFKLGIFEIDFTTVISFFIGIALGGIIVCMTYAFFVLASLRNKKFIIKTEEDNLTTIEVKEMISTCQKNFKDKSLRGDLSRIAHCKNLCVSLVYGIATRYYPKSKHPLLELSVDEVMMLTIYIENRIEEILNRRGLRLLKKIKISSIFEFTQKTNKVIDSKAFKITKEVNSTVNTVKKLINVINPAWWFRKLVFDKTMNIITNKLCLVVIAIVGEETYKIYSKTVFNQEVEIESDIDKILTSIDEDLISASNEIKNEKENEVAEVINIKEPIEFVFKMKSRALSKDTSMGYTSLYNKDFGYLKKEMKEEKESESL